ncbi:MAG: CpsD/CapB family tyrosine-protein kinase [Candidatus Thiodiazotropha endolucinida]|nr:CpsD/CapB family tyrosine-protein kinase [Candidatus Thiodiazotropha taylori]MCW4318368.1 CpsD/CapB family tyrosine-protein kinase [Candidatus Thiodiazotropha taylori]
MEKIKDALEKAKQIQLTSNNKSQKRILSSNINYFDLENISYKKTKKIKVSKNSLRSKRILIGENKDVITDQYKVLRTRVLQQMKKNNWSTLAISSPKEGCGKTLTAINLSISIARDVNQSVLLVDMDLRRPNIHNYFLTQEEPGLSDYLVKEKNLEDILFNPGIERFVVLPGNKSILNSSEMLSSPKVVQLVNELKNKYSNRLVIFDMPPLLSCDDMLAFIPYVDAVMLVVDDGVTLKQDLKRSVELVELDKLLGVVLNKSKLSSKTSKYY